MSEYQVINGDRAAAVTIAADDISDGFHTFGQLYDHRRALTAVLAAAVADDSRRAGTTSAAWRSKAHHPDDDPMFDGGYFIVGIELDSGTITYHYKLTHWDDFAAVPELKHAPKWDGATPGDTVTRLLEVARSWPKPEVPDNADHGVVGKVGCPNEEADICCTEVGHCVMQHKSDHGVPIHHYDDPEA